MSTHGHKSPCFRDTQWRDLLKAALAQGWTVESTKNSHMKWTNPQGVPIFSASSPSDPRSYKNTKSQLRRAGLKI